MTEPCHTLQRKRQKNLVNYNNNSHYDLRIIVVSPSLSLTSHEKEVIDTSFGSSYQEKSVEMISKLLLTHLIRCLDENKSISHPKTTSISPPENVALKICSI